MPGPDYLICLECETPTYIFEWVEGRVVEAVCAVCGNEDPAAFLSEDEYEEMAVRDEGSEGSDDDE